MKAINNCPHCHKNDCIPEVVFTNVEHYGSNCFSIECLHCGKMIRAYLSREVVLGCIEKSEQKESDF